MQFAESLKPEREIVKDGRGASLAKLENVGKIFIYPKNKKNHLYPLL